MTSIADNKEVNHLCRVCLTVSSSMFSLDSPLDEEISILEALEKVMSVKLLVNENYPTTVCEICKSLLKFSYDLHRVFNNTQTALKEYFQNTVRKEEADINEFRSVTPVEIAFKNDKYDLEDTVTLQEEEKEDSQFFLSNLDNSVSSVFINKPDIQPQKFSELNENTNLNESDLPLISSENNFIETNDSDLGIDDIQGCSLNELFSDHQIYDVLKENELNTPTDMLDDMQKQITYNKENTSLNKNLYKCKACGILCRNRTRLKIHLGKYHLDQSPYFCEVCASISFCINGMIESDIMFCEVCGSIDAKRKITRKKKKVNVKNKEMNNGRKHFEKQHRCILCDKAYFTKAHLTRHVKSSHKKIKEDLLCSQCGEKFSDYNGFTYHMKSHDNKMFYICEVCDKRFYMRTTFKDHIKTHTGIRLYFCKYCRKPFLSLEERNNHENIEEEKQKPYKCFYCDRRFISKFNRKAHHVTHPGPYKCGYCLQSYVELEFLKKHIKNTHKIKSNHK